jgi:molybdopterin synthase catalytic subunit
MMTPRVLVQEAPFDLAAESAALTAGREDVGAVASFVGLCRADGGLAALVLEHYPGMTERAIAGIAAEACARWPLTGCTVIHRVGRLRPGEPIVLVLTASSHRAAALESCAFLIDWLKTGAPFWKREEFADGRGERWVEAKVEDDAAASRWIARDAGSAAA